MIKAKYRCGNDLVPRISRDKAGSNLWRGLCHSWSMVESNIVWRMGDGASINCWKDNWLHSVGTLEDSLQHAPSMVENAMRVKDLVDENGG